MSDYSSYSTYVPTEETALPSTGPTTRVVGGTTSITLNGNDSVSNTSEYASVSAGDLSSYESSDWRSTARDPMGLPTNNITPASVVVIAGMSAKVGDFIKAGILRETSDGFALTSSDSQNGPRQDTEEATEEGGEEANPDAAMMPEEVASAVDTAVEPFDQSTLDAGLAHAIAAATGDMAVEDVVMGVAQRSGMDPSQAGERVQFVIDAYQAQTDNYLTSNGLGADELPAFYEWAKQSGQKAGLTAAIQQQAYARDMSAWKPLIAGFMRGVAPNLGALQANGYEVNGDLVRIDGTWMNVKAAAKAGLI
ncbi:hypothetical protein [Pandoraea sp. B-6]|uniref:hypothetical protein n=1 Tax=Pandoraea sp. B-6 TaxID=1204340 RepID=UPI0003687995|nr:hypothetical protein [Pandoraea sp. B-6]